MSSESPTVLVLDDDPSVLRSLERVFRQEGYVVETFAHPRQLLERGAAQGPRCLVMDLHMPELNGLELQEELRRQGWRHPIIFISGNGDIPIAVKAIRAGAVDFLPKPFRVADLLSSVQRALAQEKATMAEAQEHQALHARFSALSPRESQVCKLVAQGLLNKQIAAELGTAEQTVRLQRSRVMEKLSVGSVAELARLVEQLESRSRETSKTLHL